MRIASGFLLFGALACGARAPLPGHAPLAPEPVSRPPVATGLVRPAISSEGLLFRLAVIRGPTGREDSVPARYRYCYGIQGAWLAIRGAWWVAVDSTTPCVLAGPATYAPAARDVPLVVSVDSGSFGGEGINMFVFRSSVGPQLFGPPTVGTGVRRGDTLFVRGSGSASERRYILVSGGPP